MYFIDKLTLKRYWNSFAKVPMFPKIHQINTVYLLIFSIFINKLKEIYQINSNVYNKIKQKGNELIK